MKKLNLLLIVMLLFSTVSCNWVKSLIKGKEAPKTEENVNMKAEQEKLEFEKEKLRLEEERTKLESMRQESAKIRALENRFAVYDQCVVLVNKTYFHSAPNKENVTKRFIVSGDVCTLLKISNGFGYIDYYNYESEKTTSGWIDLADLEHNYAD